MVERPHNEMHWVMQKINSKHFSAQGKPHCSSSVRQNLTPDASYCTSGASKTRVKPFIKEMGSFPQVLW